MNRSSAWPARLGVLGALGLLALLWRAFFAFADLDPQGTEVLRGVVSHEYRSYQLARSDLDRDALAQLLERADTVRFRRVSARHDGRRLIVRVELEPNPAAPPSSPQVRYFRMEHDLVTGWVYASSASALSYYTAPIVSP